MIIKNVFSQFKEGLYKSRIELANKLELLFSNSKDKLDFLEKLEELLILSDLGTSATIEIINEFKQINFREYKENNFIFFKEKLKVILINILNSTASNFKIDECGLNMIMLVGVNGSGKTSVAGKIAYRLKNKDKDILMIPADTFRAAAIQQLKILADKVGVEMINAGEGADPASVVYDGISAARVRKKNVVIIDTAGRLHTKINLMSELEKIKRVILKEANNYSLEILQTIDATMGQNVIAQAKSFHNSLGVTGIALTKMDGTAKGGIIIAIKKELDIPVKLISCGEKLNNLYDFEADKFVKALLD
ncbi:signal recognition particle-docking protein FtsY [Candidatus Atribacteria bacterium MT.SAG.1]|nr:signal recognition particle-docking protein FtsY [Candidatus Atribacteria bacterium MT.SAG.1]